MSLSIRVYGFQQLSCTIAETQPLKEELRTALCSNSLQFPGSFAASFAVNEHPLPCICVRGDNYHQLFRLPIPSHIDTWQHWYSKDEVRWILA
jgi:hypothetical protein